MTDEISSNKSSLEEIWAPCKLNRRGDAEAILRFLKNLHENKQANSSEDSPNNYVINIDAGWGYGKTFFLDKLQQHLEVENYMVAPINAWESDYTDEPLLIAMGAIQDALTEGDNDFREKARETFTNVLNNAGTILAAGAKGATIQVGKRLLGEAGETEIADAILNGSANVIGSALEKELEIVKKSQNSIQDFRDGIQQLVTQKTEGKDGKKLPLFVIIDELDRCRPDYAISFLEAIKHIFSISDVYFIIATDTEQLQHSIKAVYGAEFDAKEYLKRFFDRTLHLSDISHENFIAYLLEKKFGSSTDWQEGFARHKYVKKFAEITHAANLQLRSIEQVMDIFEFSVTEIAENHDCEPVLIFIMITLYRLGIGPSFNDILTHKNTYSELLLLETEISILNFPLQEFVKIYDDYTSMSPTERGIQKNELNIQLARTQSEQNIRDKKLYILKWFDSITAYETVITQASTMVLPKGV